MHVFVVAQAALLLPSIYKPLVYIFFAQSIAPSFNTYMYQFVTEELNFSNEFLSTVRADISYFLTTFPFI